ncbi:MAG: hypothetical protein HYR84_02595, partial [Planctomycetes bacterium]|nr:hypothetical protein [Planctomycetota bacterium]
MNAAFLLVTSALVVGQGTAVDKKPADKPAAAAPAAASCGHNCGCDGFGHRLRDRLRSAFSRDCNDACKPTACPTHHVHTPIFRSSCDDCGRTRLFNWQPACREPKACAPAKCHDPCDRPNLLSRLRDRFQRGDRCCTSTAAPAKKTEKIETTPKKLPTDKDKGG